MDTEIAQKAFGQHARWLFVVWLASTVAGCGSNSTGPDSTGKFVYLPNLRAFEGEMVDKISCRAMAFSPKGDLLFAGGTSFMIHGCRVRVLDPSLEHEVTSLPVPISTGCEFLPDRTAYFVGSTFGEVLRCDAVSGMVLNQVRDHHETVNDIAVSPDGRWLATSADDGTVALRDTSTLVTLHNLSVKDETVRSLAFTSDSQKLFAGTCDGTIQIWTLVDAPHIIDRISAEFPVRAMTLSPDDSLVFASGSKCCDSGFTKIWSVESGKLLKTLPHQPEIVFSPDGASLAIASSENAIVTVHDPKTLEERFRVVGNHASHYTLQFDPAIAFSPDSQTLAIGVDDIRLVRVSDGTEQSRFNGLSRLIRTVQFSPSGQTLAAANAEGDLVVWNPTTQTILHERRKLFPQIRSLRFMGNTEHILVYDGASEYRDYGAVQAIDPKTKKIERWFKGHTEPVYSVAVSPDGTQVCTSSSDRTVRVWDTNSRRELNSVREQKSPVYSVAYSPDGSLIAAAGHQISLWNATLSENLRELPGSSGLQYCVRFSSDQSSIAAGGQDGIVRVWQLPEGTLRWSSGNHGHPIRAMAFLPTGKRLLAAGGESSTGAAYLFDADSGEEVMSLDVPEGAITCAEIAENGSEVYMSGLGKTVRTWNPTTGKTVTRSQVLEGPVAAIAVNREGNLIVAAGRMGCRWFKR